MDDDMQDQGEIVTSSPGVQGLGATQRILLSYRLLAGCVEVRILAGSPVPRYVIRMAPAREGEPAAVQAVLAGYRSQGGQDLHKTGKVPFSYANISAYLSNQYPLIPAGRHRLIYHTLSFRMDPVRWIRVMLADPAILRLVCLAPGRPVFVWHTSTGQRMRTSIVPTRSDLILFARFLLHASGQQEYPEDPEFFLRFASGEEARFVRVSDQQGQFFRIDIRKPTMESSLQKSSKKGGNPGVEDSQYDTRISKLLDRVYDQPTGMTGTTDGGEAAHQNEVQEDEEVRTPGFMAGVLNSLRSGIPTFSLKQAGGKKLGNQQVPPLKTHQIPSVLNVQGGDGVVAEEAYWLSEPHAYAVIVQDSSKDRTYRIIEPELSPKERIILEETHETLRDMLVYDTPVRKGELCLEFEEVAKVVRTYDPRIPDDRLSVLYYYLKRNLNGYGKIDALMYDELLEDISCNGHNLPVYVHHRIYGSIPTSIWFEAEDLNRFVLKLSQKADKQVSLTSPLLDASLPNGSRAQITYSDVVSTKGSSFTIRKFRSDPMTPATLLSFGTYSTELLAFIWLTLENRQSMIVVGGTASGKTSAMNAFSFFIPHNSKIVSLEDTREIQIPQKNWLPVQTRASSSSNDRGNVDLFDLLKASLRQRPEYIIVGEVRGNEAQTLFQAMNSGHTTISTLHAGNIEEALNRLTNEPINVPPAMFGALNLMVIQTFHYRDGRMIRRCDAIHEILLGEGDKVKWNTLFEYVPENDSFRRVYNKSKTLKTIQYMHNWSDEEIQYQLDLRTAFLSRLRHQYSTDPGVMIQMITDLRRMA